MKATRIRVAVVIAVCALIVALPALAYASAPFASEYPVSVSGTPVYRVAPQVVGVDLVGTPLLVQGSQTLSIDGTPYSARLVNAGSVSGGWSASEILVGGVWRIHWTWSANSDLTKSTIYAYPTYVPALTDGSHVVVATVKDITGHLYTDTWSFTVGAAPTFGAPTPADGVTVSTLSPVISVPVADNGGVTGWTVTVNGVSSTAARTSGDAKNGVLTITPGAALTNDTDVPVAVTIHDAAGNTAAL